MSRSPDAFAVSHSLRSNHDLQLTRNARDDGLDLAHDNLGLEPQHAIPAADQHGVPLRISPRAFGMIRGVDFGQEPLSLAAKSAMNRPSKGT